MRINMQQKIEEYLQKHTNQQDRIEEIGTYYPSLLPYCLKKQYYHKKNPKTRTPQLLRIYAAGDLIHKFATTVLTSLDMLKKMHSEMPITYTDPTTGITLKGRIDAYLIFHPDQKIIIEIKSVSKTPHKPNPTHISQLQAYLGMTGLKKGILIYIEKNTLNTTEHEITYNEHEFKRIISRARLLNHCLQENTPPPAEPNPNECKYCPYRQECRQQTKNEVNEKHA